MTSPDKTVLGLQLFQQAQQHAAGRIADAASAYQKAVALLPSHPALVLAYATLAEDVKDWAAAEKLYRHLGTLRPNSNFEGKLAICLFRLERWADAVPLLRTHLARHPGDTDMMLLLGLALSKLKRWQEAYEVGSARDALTHDVDSIDIMLNALYNLGDKAALDALVAQAIARHPDQPKVLSLCATHLLKRGDYDRSFGYMRAIRWRYDPAKPDFDTLPDDWWDGQPFDGVLLIEGEQGLGEEILGASMFEELVLVGQRAVIEVEPRLLALFRRSFPTLEFVARGQGELQRIMASGASYRRIQTLDLGIFFRREGRFPPRRAWLVGDTLRSAALRDRYHREHAGQRLAGISWKSKREFVFGPDKSIALEELAPLLAVPGVTWMNVQYGDIAPDCEAVASLGLTPPAVDPEIDPTQDLDGLAAQMLALDFVVSTSNTTAHLAGALGVPCHLLLPKSRPVLWYWGYDGDTTPWYPSIAIHRNTREDDWRAFAAQVAAGLARPDGGA